MKQIAGRLCWFVYGLALLLCIAQMAVDSSGMGAAFFGSTLGIAIIVFFIGGAALCAIWDS